MIDWAGVIESLVPDDPMETSPALQGYSVALELRRLGRNLATAGALASEHLRGRRSARCTCEGLA